MMKHNIISLDAFLIVFLFTDSIDVIERIEPLKNYFLCVEKKALLL